MICFDITNLGCSCSSEFSRFSQGNIYLGFSTLSVKNHQDSLNQDYLLENMALYRVKYRVSHSKVNKVMLLW